MNLGRIQPGIEWHVIRIVTSIDYSNCPPHSKWCPKLPLTISHRKLSTRWDFSYKTNVFQILFNFGIFNWYKTFVWKVWREYSMQYRYSYTYGNRYTQIQKHVHLQVHDKARKRQESVLRWPPEYDACTLSWLYCMYIITVTLYLHIPVPLKVIYSSCISAVTEHVGIDKCLKVT